MIFSPNISLFVCVFGIFFPHSFCCHASLIWTLEKNTKISKKKRMHPQKCVDYRWQWYLPYDFCLDALSTLHLLSSQTFDKLINSLETFSSFFLLPFVIYAFLVCVCVFISVINCWFCMSMYYAGCAFQKHPIILFMKFPIFFPSSNKRRKTKKKMNKEFGFI